MTTAETLDGFAARAAEVAQPLRDAFAQLSASAALDEKLRDSVHPSIRSRVSRALATENALASLHRMPGPDGLRRVLRAAQRRGADPALIAACERCIANYERFCAAEDISRQTLQGILANYLPEARDAAFRASCQSAYKARSIITGYHADALLLTLFIYPGTRPDRCSVAVLRGCRGWRRLRQDCMFAAHGYRVRDTCDDSDLTHTDIEGRDLAALGRAPLLEQFCSKPLPKFQRIEIPHGCSYYLMNDDVGMRSTCTFFVAEVLGNSQYRYRAPSPSSSSDPGRNGQANHSGEPPDVAIESLLISTPCKRVVFDTFIHRDVWPGVVPEIEFFNTVPQGAVTEDSYAYRRHHDRMELGATLRPLQNGAMETAAVKNYNALVQFMLKRIRYAPGGDEFRAYRCELSYPLYGSQAALCVPLPDGP